MKLEWRMSKPEPSDRVFCHVPEGCLFADIPPRGRVFISILATKRADVGGILPDDWMGREFDTAQEAIDAMEAFYFKAKELPCNPSSPS